jgi:hypothetical protein
MKFASACVNVLAWFTVCSIPCAAKTATDSRSTPQATLTTDRPDTTEAALTVPRGLWQVESTLFGYSRDDVGGLRTETFTWGSMNVKYGISENTDLQLIYDLWTRERTRGGTLRLENESFSDVTLRLKHNIHGNNEASGVAWAFMPYVKVPTSTALSNREWEGGLIVPFGMEVIPDVLDVNWMLEADAVYDEDSDSHDAVFLHSISLAWSLTKLGLPEALGIFTEYVGESGAGDYRAYANGGFVLVQRECPGLW